MRWSRRGAAAPLREAPPRAAPLRAAPPREAPSCDIEFLDVGPDGEQHWVTADADVLGGPPEAPPVAHYLLSHAPGYDPEPPPPPPDPPSTPVSRTALTCIRLNCDEQGRPTDVPRCPRCGHATQLLRNSRWPRRTG